MTKKKRPEDLLKLGRPTKYTVELGNEICDEIASSDVGLVHLVNANSHWPARSKILLWLRLYPDFRDNYYKAKEDQCEAIVEYMHETMNEEHKSVDEDSGEVTIDVPLLKLKIDYLKWQAGKLKCKKFGDLKTEESLEQNKVLHEEAMQRKSALDEENKKEY